LFGESDKERRLRLRALELLEDKGAGAGLNDFRRTMAEMERGMDEKELRKQAGASHRAGEEKEKKEEAGVDKDEKRKEVGVIDLKLVKTDPNKLYPLIYYALKVSTIARSMVVC
jgi:pre-mRNA-splicing factor 18